MRVCNQNPSRRSSVLLSQNPNVYPFCQKQTLVFGGVGHPQSLSLNAAADRGLYTSPLSRRVGSRGGSALEASRGRRAGRQPGRTRALQAPHLGAAGLACMSSLVTVSAYAHERPVAQACSFRKSPPACKGQPLQMSTVMCQGLGVNGVAR